MEIRWLRSFMAVAEEMHFSQAARRLHLAQPALTAHIQHLEDAVGQRLIDRGNRLRGLTPAGVALVAEARSILERADRLRQITAAAAEGKSGRLRAGMIPPAATGAIADIFRVFSLRWPEVRVEITFGGQDRLIALLIAGELDLVIARPEHHGSALSERFLCEEEQGVAVREDDPITKGGRISLRKLDGRRLLLLRDNLHFGQLLLEHAARHQTTLYPSHDASDFSSLYWMVRAGFGIAPVSLSMDPQPGVAACPLRPAPPKLKLHTIFLGGSRSPSVVEWMKISKATLRSSEESPTRTTS